MSSALKQAEEIVDILNPQERLDLLQYLAPKLVMPSVKDRSMAEGLLGMRDSRGRMEPAINDSAANWARLKELGHEMDGQREAGNTLGQILTEMRG
jgi:hypothetical protein